MLRPTSQSAPLVLGFFGRALCGVLGTLFIISGLYLVLMGVDLYGAIGTVVLSVLGLDFLVAMVRGLEPVLAKYIPSF